MKLKKFLCRFILAAAMLIVCPMGVLAAGGVGNTVTDIRGSIAWPQGPSIACRSAYLLECKSGQVLYSQNADEARFPASITKVLTALVVLEHASLDEQVTFSHAAVTDLEEGGFNGYFCEREVLTVEDCLYALLLSSVNECGYALAEHVAGSVSAFADMMNEKAASLGCTNSNFVNPHGLNDPNHTTTAHDMAIIFRAAIQNDTFLKIDSTLKYQIKPTPHMTHGFTCTLHNQLCNPESDNYYNGAKAGKTGYTSLAYNTLVTYAERDGMELIAVVMKGEGTGKTYSDTKKLFNYGFDNFSVTDYSALGGAFTYMLNSVSPLPLSSSGGLAICLPKTATGVSAQFIHSDTGIGSFSLTSGGKALMNQKIAVDDELLKQTAQPLAHEIVPKETKPQPTKAEDEPTDPDTPAADPLPGTEERTSVGTVIWNIVKVILIVAAILIVLVGIYWCVIQIIKARRRKKRREYMARKARMERIKAIRGQKDEF